MVQFSASWAYFTHLGLNPVAVDCFVAISLDNKKGISMSRKYLKESCSLKRYLLLSFKLIVYELLLCSEV